MSAPRVAVVGATGLVGSAFVELLDRKNFKYSELRLFASEKSVNHKIKTLDEKSFEGIEIAFFSSGDNISLEWAPKALAMGATVIDNSAAFRMNPKHKLIVPEVNGRLLKKGGAPEIIANPNCSTIQLVMVLHSLLNDFGLTDVRVASYQSVSGAGRAALEELKAASSAMLAGGEFETKEFVKPIAFNTIPQVGGFDEFGFCSEENKIMAESKKILGSPDFKISAFTVRVPTMNGHAEAVWVTLKKKATRDDVIQSLKKMNGVKVHSDMKSYPTVRFECDDYVHVGRIHQDQNLENTFLMWIVSDNLLKGAALNGIQIAEKLF